MLAAVLLLDERGRLAADLRRVLAVDRDTHRALLRRSGKLDLQVEARAGQDLGAVERIDRLGMGARSNRQSEAKRGQPGHAVPSIFADFPL